MRAVKAQNTRPEMIVRRLLHQKGYRFRLHRSDLPGKPDIVFAKRQKLVFVHGCFWHGHWCKRGNRTPKTNVVYWKAKVARNVERYTDQLDELSVAGWDCLTLWECELSDTGALFGQLAAFLGPPAGFDQ